MSSWTYYSETIDRIYWTGVAVESALRHEVETRLSSIPGLSHILSATLEDASQLPEEENTARTVIVRGDDPSDFGRCPGTHGHLCCNYLTLNVYVGCTLGCTYCIMQSYLRNRTLEVRIPSEESIERIRALVARYPDRIVRLGTGEVGDSLLYDPLFGVSAHLIDRLRDLPNLRFELKSKTDYVDHLPDGGGAVISFSLNPPEIIGAEEGSAAPLERRLDAARRAARNGYRLAFHFDPMIRIPDWRERYLAVADQLGTFRETSPEWISLGTLRYPMSLRRWIEARPYGLAEFVSSGDGKMRYLQKVRAEMYRTMKERLQDLLPETPVYLCMESGAMWRHLQERVGDRSGRLGSIMRPIDEFGAAGAHGGVS